ncbi:Putative phosphinothricin acetyltransferase YwnH [Pelagimonas phthalicica]|uniref:Putative phosphinothricin acetyltransferase YwnH n=1 Tax=Pelagimonas phthalicica TaxID=1037362 RepID=A0A238J651_9RHOB|nr:GNAT family N-acetyltransferase [Pelagimonas phthalicica]TDS95245.1 L-amino acid N-acyltransferase YncA [Pelagimonas phthalicica]SMX26231.1 Putative phosphinothricin acetyltransferase YwnH [Pelagimonas phthalicica]
MITIRRAGALDARPMAELLNEIIAKGGTTALTTPVTAEDMKAWMMSYPDRSAWHIAEDDGGELLGFQMIKPESYLPEDAVDIATFARVGRVKMGIGSALFEKTRQAAEQMGYAWINANIRADNFGGLAYYQSRGFEDYATKRGVQLESGQTVDKCLKRFDL